MVNEKVYVRVSAYAEGMDQRNKEKKKKDREREYSVGSPARDLSRPPKGRLVLRQTEDRRMAQVTEGDRDVSRPGLITFYWHVPEVGRMMVYTSQGNGTKGRSDDATRRQRIVFQVKDSVH